MLHWIKHLKCYDDGQLSKSSIFSSPKWTDVIHHMELRIRVRALQATQRFRMRLFDQSHWYSQNPNLSLAPLPTKKKSLEFTEKLNENCRIVRNGKTCIELMMITVYIQLIKTWSLSRD